MKKTYIVGALLLIITATLIVVSLPNNVKMDITKSSSTFSVWENNSWVVSGVESNSLYNGTKSISRGTVTISNVTNGNLVTIIRNAKYGKTTIIDTYTFDGNTKDVELFPVFHTIEIINGIGLIYQYKVDKLLYSGPTKLGVTSPQSFGHNMKIEYSDNYYSKLTNSNLVLKYNVTTNNEIYNIRLFDPIIPCYQEYANISTSCGGLDTGSYAFSGQWTNEQNSIDGNWSSYGSALVSSTELIVIYKIPTNSSNTSIFRIKNNDNETVNISIPSQCWNITRGDVRFQITTRPLNANEIDCWSGTPAWIPNIYTGTELPFGRFYEEAMIWNNSVPVSITQSPANNTGFNILNNTFQCNVSSDNLTSIGVNVYDNCYQEFANVSTSCGGLSTGTYTDNSNWSEVNLIYDGDWVTYSNSITDNTDGYLWINYTKPTGASNTSLWTIGEMGDLVVVESNFSLNSCWNYSNTLSFRIWQNTSGTSWETYYQCFNGSWVTLKMNNETSWQIAEEAMVWNILINNATNSVSGTSNSSTFSFDIYSGNYTWNCWTNSSIGITNGDTYNLINPENVIIEQTNSSALFIFRNNKINASQPDGQIPEKGFFNVTNVNVRNISVYSSVNYTVSNVTMKASGNSNYSNSIVLDTTNKTLFNLSVGGNYIWFWADYVNYSGAGFKYAPKLTIDYA
jgi:hypothetical protein